MRRALAQSPAEDCIVAIQVVLRAERAEALESPGQAGRSHDVEGTANPPQVALQRVERFRRGRVACVTR